MKQSKLNIEMISGGFMERRDFETPSNKSERLR